MPKLIKLSQKAKQNVNDILENVYNYTLFPSTPKKLLNEFKQTFNKLSILPKMGKQQEDGSRMIFCRYYRILYQELDDCIIIITIIHSRKRYP